MAAQKKSRGLGKGLDALFGDVEVALKKDDEKPPEQEAKDDAPSSSEEGGIRYIDINYIRPNSNRSRGRSLTRKS